MKQHASTTRFQRFVLYVPFNEGACRYNSLQRFALASLCSWDAERGERSEASEALQVSPINVGTIRCNVLLWLVYVPFYVTVF